MIRFNRMGQSPYTDFRILPDPLVQALRAAKVTRNFALKKCCILP
jgi:hypothetical protein